MRYLNVTLALVLAASAAGAQQPATGHAHQKAHGAATAACPLHLTTLDLTPTQDSAFKAIRARHMAEMKSLHESMGMPAMDHQPGTKHDSAMRAAHMKAMKQAKPEAMRAAHDSMHASMERAFTAARAVLTPAQRTKFDAAVKAHEAEMSAGKGKGMPRACADCC